MLRSMTIPTQHLIPIAIVAAKSVWATRFRRQAGPNLRLPPSKDPCSSCRLPASQLPKHGRAVRVLHHAPATSLCLHATLSTDWLRAHRRGHLHFGGNMTRNAGLHTCHHLVVREARTHARAVTGDPYIDPRRPVSASHHDAKARPNASSTVFCALTPWACGADTLSTIDR
jgi:hypothetical protein